MSRLVQYEMRNEPVTFRERVVEAVRSFRLGPFSMKTAKGWGDPLGLDTSRSGVHVGEAEAMRSAAFWCAVTMIAADIASLPLVLLKRGEDGGKVRYDGHPLYRLLHDQPNGEMTSVMFRETLMLHALLGNGYAEIERDGAGRPVALWPIEPHRVRLERDSSGNLKYVVTNSGGKADSVIDKADMVHIAGPSPTGLLGYDVVHQAREALGLSIAAERFGSTFFSNGTVFGGIISVAGNLNELQRKNLREAIEAKHKGTDRAHRFALLDNGATYQGIGGTTPEQSQYMELRTHQIREVARFFKMPPSRLGDLADATFANVEQENLKYYSSCLRPWIERIEQELTVKLISPLERNKQVIEHVTEGFLRADHGQRADFYASALSHGWMTVNEVRERENMPPIAGGDKPRVPMNTEYLGEEASSGTPRSVGAQVLSAHRALIFDAVRRTMRHWVTEASLITTRSAASRWFGYFEDEMRISATYDSFRPLFLAYSALLGVEADTDAITDRFVRQVYADAHRQWEEAYGEHADGFAERWDTLKRRWQTAPQRLADRMVEDAIARLKPMTPVRVLSGSEAAKRESRLQAAVAETTKLQTRVTAVEVDRKWSALKAERERMRRQATTPKRTTRAS